MPFLTFSIDGKSHNATKLEVSTRDFSFIVDEPENLGGKDEGPNPVEYLLGSYAGCLNVVLNLIAKEQNIEINSLNIHINGGIDPARLFGQTKKSRAGFQYINVNISIDANASEEAIKDLVEKAKDRCPVNDNLSNITEINYKVNSLEVAV